jgi:restriction system protein
MVWETHRHKKPATCYSTDMSRRARKKNHRLFIDDPELFLVLIIALVLLVADWTTRIVVLIGALIIGLIYYAWFLRKQSRGQRAGIDQIDQMTGQEFEQRLRLLFMALGYKVTMTRATGDFGADLLLAKDGKRTVVQAKRYSKAIGVAAIQEVIGAKAYYSCPNALVVTNANFTNAARILAHANQVVLWDRDRLISELNKVSTRGIPGH